MLINPCSVCLKKTRPEDSPFSVTKPSVMSLITRQKEGNKVKKGRKMKSSIMLIWLPFAP